MCYDNLPNKEDLYISEKSYICDIRTDKCFEWEFKQDVVRHEISEELKGYIFVDEEGYNLAWEDFDERIMVIEHEDRYIAFWRDL